MIWPSTEESTPNQRITMTMIPAVLLNAIWEYNFIGSPLWRMSDGKDFVHMKNKNDSCGRLARPKHVFGSS